MIVVPDPPILDGLNPPAAKLGRDYLSAFPVRSSIVSGRRSIDEQARADAQCVVERRDFILTTYWPGGVDPRDKSGWAAEHPGDVAAFGAVKGAMLAVCDANPAADEPTLATLFAACLGRFTDGQLLHFSMHLSGNALDLAPVGDPEREDWCERYIQRWIDAGGSARSRVLDREAGMPRLHCQIL